MFVSAFFSFRFSLRQLTENAFTHQEWELRFKARAPSASRERWIRRGMSRCPLFQTQGCARALAATGIAPSPPGEARSHEALQWDCSSLPFGARYASGGSSAKNNSTRCEEQGPDCGPESLKGKRVVAPFRGPFPTKGVLLRHLVHLLRVLCVSSARTFFY